MMRKMPALFLFALVAAVGCNRVPGHVISPDDMAEIMADLNTAEAVAETNHAMFPNDSTRRVLRRSVYIAHGISEAEFDTSMMWYGRNIDKYIEMCERTIDILEARQKKLGTQMSDRMGMSVSGDSVDVWQSSHYLNLNNRLPSGIIYFSLSADDNWRPGDYYTWRMKMINGEPSTQWGFIAEYDDGTVETLNLTTTGRLWTEASFMSDSAKTMKELRGYVDVGDQTGLYVDSITLVRKRVDPEKYPQRYRQRRFKSAEGGQIIGTR